MDTRYNHFFTSFLFYGVLHEKTIQYKEKESSAPKKNIFQSASD